MKEKPSNPMAEFLSNLHRILASGKFAVTAECGPPRGANKNDIIKKAKLLKGFADSINVTDNQTAIVRMSSIAACAHLHGMGLEPVMQMVTRDRNRIALQSDIMGAWSLGIRNILCLSGDHQKFGSQPDALNVFDIDSMHLVRAVKNMREDGTDMSGFKLKEAPRMFIGAAANPFADPFDYRIIRLAKKIEAGVDFIQTQCIFNIEKFKKWIKIAREEGLTEKVFILAGITPLKSAGMAKYMRDKVPGMDVPEVIIERMENVPKDKAGKEGIKICVETINEVLEIKGVRGIHIMAIEWEEKVEEIVKSANLYPRPVVS
jgi:methylenetetrahydrofolate reductase (NADPH)